MSVLSPSCPSSPLLASSNSLSSEPSTSSSSPASSNHGHSARPSQKQKKPRIRFAPLPDPRRAVLITEQGCEFPIVKDNDSTFSAADLVAAIQQSSSPEHFLLDLPDSDSLYSRSRSPAIAPSTPRSSSPLTSSTPMLKSKSAQSKSLLKKPFPFLKRPQSSPSDGVVSSGFPTEQMLSLGTINLFRSSSRDSRESASSRSRWSSTPLGRWSSASSSDRTIDAQLNRSSSITSDNKKSLSKMLSSPLSQSPKRAPPPKSSRKGTRMLNGRIYGGPRQPLSSVQPGHPNYRPFENARDEAEPSFVEWGYGGMGSVKSGNGGMGRSGSFGSSAPKVDWGRVQAGAGDEENGGDDGSGMGWVQKRKEAREKAAREKAEKEKATEEAEKEKAVEEAETESASTTTTVVKPSTVQESISVPEEEEHICSAVTLPPRRTNSHSQQKAQPETEPRAEPDSVSDDGIDDLEEEENGESVDGDDEEEEEEHEEGARKTALCAGVEKISRHKD